MKALDLFAGCGGLSLGFMGAGYELLAAFENWEPAIRVYRQNFHHPIFPYDLNIHKDNMIFQQYNPEIIIGGPPCQDFSSAGKRDEEGAQSELTITFAHIVSKVRPSLFVMENVDRAARSKAFLRSCTMLAETGYGLTQHILDASLCGVPQQRKRLFLIGHFGGADNALKPFLQGGLSKKPLTVREYLGDMLGVEHYYRHPRSYQRRAIFSIDEPSPTIRGVNRPVPGNYRRHPGDTAPTGAVVRPLTTKERSLIQTFPKEFVFSGTKSEIEQMIGNAVPVKQAEYVAKCIIRYLQHLNLDGKQEMKPALSNRQVQQLSML